MGEIQENMNEVGKSWSDLPEDILSSIKSHLFARDYYAFGAVCRSWRSTYIPIRPLPPPIGCPFRSSPCLIFVSVDEDMSTKLFHPIYNDVYSMDIPELYGAFIQSCKYGWLLVSVDNSMFFLNPFTREKIELPNSDLSFDFACFSSSPTSDDCMVVGFYGVGTIMNIGLLRRGRKIWDTYFYESEKNFMSSNCNPILFKGSYYLLGMGENIGVFDLENLTWGVYIKPYEVQRQKSLGQGFLSELDGMLVAVFVLRDYRVQFFSLDLNHMVLQPEETIGDKMLYVSYGSAFSKSVVANGMSNKIYFPILSGSNGVMYSLSTKSFHSFADGSLTHNKMQKLEFSTWIEPNYERVGHENLIW